MDFSEKHSSKRGPSGYPSIIARLIDAIGYPERAPGDVSSFTLRVDGQEILAEERDGRLILSRKLTEDDALLPSLAGYAAGRMLREEAVLAADPGVSGAFLWQDAPATADAPALVRLFEAFLDSCDWWRARVAGDADKPEAVPAMMIRP